MEQAEAAIEQLYSPSTTPQQKHEAQLWLQSCQENQSGWELGLQLLNSNVKLLFISSRQTRNSLEL